MWPRIVESLLAVWLLVSSAFFDTDPAMRMSNLACGVLILLLSAASFTQIGRWAHLATGAVAIWMIAFAYFGWHRPGPPAAQNAITIGWLLLSLVILPSESSSPPPPWRDHYKPLPWRNRKKET